MKENIFKKFEFESEDVKLILYIIKEFHRTNFRLVIDGEAHITNPDLKLDKNSQEIEVRKSFNYLNHNFFWLDFNEYKGLRWDKYSNETKSNYFRDLKGLKEAYIIQSDFIPIIADYFYESIRKYKRAKLLYEVKFDEIISDSVDNI